MYLQSIEIAEWFVKTYYQEVIDFFMDPLNIYGYDILANTLKMSLDKKLISLDDFLSEDEVVIYKIKSSKDNEVQDLLNQLHQNLHVIEDRTHYDLHRKNKIHLIDTSIYCRDELVKASILSNKVRNMGNAANEKAIRVMYVKII